MYSIEDIKSNVLFRDADVQSLNFSFDPNNIKEIKEGEIFYQSGDNAGFFYLILSGRVKLKHSISKKVLVKSSDEFFGEAEIIHDSTRKYSVVADSDCVVYKMQSENLKQLIKNSEHIKNTLHDILQRDQSAKSESTLHALKSIEIKSDTVKLDIKTVGETPPQIKKSEKVNNLVDKIIGEIQEKPEKQNLPSDSKDVIQNIIEEVLVTPAQQTDYNNVLSDEKIEIEESTEFIKSETKNNLNKIEIIESVSGQTEKALKNKDKFILDLHEKELQKFQKILQPSPDIIKAVKDIFYFLLKITDSEIGAFYMYNVEENKLEETLQSFSSFYKSKRPVKDGITAIVAKEKKLRVVDYFEKDSSFNADIDLPNEFKGKTLIFMPLVDMNNNLLAIVQTGSDQTEFSKDEIKTFENAINYSSYVLFNSINYKEPPKKINEPADIGLIANFVVDDVKTSLMVIKKYSALLNKMELQDDGKKAASIILAKSVATIELLQSLLEVANGKINLIFEVISFKDALNHILVMLADSIDLRKTKLFKKLTDDAIIKVDTHKLYIACYYITKFASDMMQDDGKLYFSNYIDGNKIVLKINDESTGIGSDMIGNLFDDFFYINNEKKTGLGLSVAKQLITNMKGDLKIETASKGISYIISFDIISR